ncbi:MAG TPA: prepilin-type N-terminal cleavage/methylation domain-containing protein [Hyphomicrobiaceae bacterium]|jgi:prepilin-type N-terminal cleavage/methylation domain-containing protein|nr:prepilin-type N-terminal cleavage/methylation domain-containing protein [Hyphomicrobiaceae bacterium]
MARRCCSGERDAGFTLMETIVALIIFVACYVLIQQGLSLGWRGVSASQGELAALHVAQAHLAATGVEAPLSEGQQAGNDNGYAWVVDVRRQNAEAESESRAKTHPTGYWVAVEVSWRDEVTRRQRSLQLKTLKVALPQ